MEFIYGYAINAQTFFRSFHIYNLFAKPIDLWSLVDIPLGLNGYDVVCFSFLNFFDMSIYSMVITFSGRSRTRQILCIGCCNIDYRVKANASRYLIWA